MGKKKKETQENKQFRMPAFCKTRSKPEQHELKCNLMIIVPANTTAHALTVTSRASGEW